MMLLTLLCMVISLSSILFELQTLPDIIEVRFGYRSPDCFPQLCKFLAWILVAVGAVLHIFIEPAEPDLAIRAEFNEASVLDLAPIARRIACLEDMRNRPFGVYPVLFFLGFVVVPGERGAFGAYEAAHRYGFLHRLPLLGRLYIRT